MSELLRRGDVVWVAGELPGDPPHPHVVLSIDDGAIDACAVTSNVGRAKGAGNVLLTAGEAGLERESVILAAVMTVPRSRIGAAIGSLSAERLEELERGVAFVERLRR